MFSVGSKKYMAMTVMMIDRGMDTPTIRVVGRLRRNISRIRIARAPPIRAVCQTLEMAMLMKSAETNTSTRRTSSGRERFRLSMRSCTRLVISTVLVPDCFCTLKMIASLRPTSTSVSSSA